jgi:hypothetical protein
LVSTTSGAVCGIHIWVIPKDGAVNTTSLLRSLRAATAFFSACVRWRALNSSGSLQRRSWGDSLPGRTSSILLARAFPAGELLGPLEAPLHTFFAVYGGSGSLHSLPLSSGKTSTARANATRRAGEEPQSVTRKSEKTSTGPRNIRSYRLAIAISKGSHETNLTVLTGFSSFHIPHGVLMFERKVDLF